MSFTAADLRYSIQMLHQPHYAPTEKSLLRTAICLHRLGVTARRVQNAAAAVYVSDTGVTDTLVQYLTALSLPVVAPILLAADDDDNLRRVLAATAALAHQS